MMNSTVRKRLDKPPLPATPEKESTGEKPITPIKDGKTAVSTLRKAIIQSELNWTGAAQRALVVLAMIAFVLRSILIDHPAEVV